jgi:hypothetical protein
MSAAMHVLDCATIGTQSILAKKAGIALWDSCFVESSSGQLHSPFCFRVFFAGSCRFDGPIIHCNISGIHFKDVRSTDPHLTNFPHLVRYRDLPLSAADNIDFRVILQGIAH